MGLQALYLLPSSSSSPLSTASYDRLWRPPSLAILFSNNGSSSNPSLLRRHRCGPRAYLDDSNSVSGLVNKVVGALPVIGLFARILSDDGGVGSDRIQFKEFCTRVYRSFSPEVITVFFDFEQRHGSIARPQYVLLWCWAAALGAGLLKTEDLMLGAARLRVSFDIQFEEENFNLLMDQAAKKRLKSKSPVPFIPYEARAAKALDAICKCCLSKANMEEEDVQMLTVMLQSVFPGADKAEIERLVREKAAEESKDLKMDISEATSEDSARAMGDPEAGGNIMGTDEQAVKETALMEEKLDSFV